jgi:hypothetical protein
MKKTFITVALTTLIVLTLIGVVSFLFAPRVGNTFSNISSGLDVGGYGGGSPDNYAMPAEAPAAPEPAQFYAEDASRAFDLSYDEAVAQSNVPATERLVIQIVDMSIVVTDPKARMQEISDLAVEMGGFVVSSNLYQSTYGPNNIEVPGANMTIRIPSQRLDEALESIKEGAVEITYENRSGQDVTSQYVDLQSRLSVMQDAEKKLLEIMENADTSEDVLAIFLQVQNVQTEIEVLKGQIKYYDESVALSAVSIGLVAEAGTQPIEIGGWKLPETANQAVQDLIRFTQGFAQFLVRFFLNYLWRIILVVLPLYGAFIGGRALFRRFRKSKVDEEVKEEEKK